MPSASDAALRKIEQAIARDPVLRDVLNLSAPSQTKGGRFAPDIDVIELDDRYVILLDVPGVPRNTLTVDVEGVRMIVTGERPSQHPDGGRSKMAERRTGSFKREFLLPSQANAEGIVAKMADGVLRVEVPKSGAGKAVRVTVE